MLWPPTTCVRKTSCALLTELTRLLTDRFDAEAEAVAVLGQRLAALGAQVEQMQEELHELHELRPRP